MTNVSRAPWRGIVPDAIRRRRARSLTSVQEPVQDGGSSFLTNAFGFVARFVRDNLNTKLYVKFNSPLSAFNLAIFEQTIGEYGRRVIRVLRSGSRVLLFLIGASEGAVTGPLTDIAMLSGLATDAFGRLSVATIAAEALAAESLAIELAEMEAILMEAAPVLFL